MPVDFVTLLRRDHADLQRELTQLLDPSASAHDLRTALDGVRLGLTAHAEAEDIVLSRLAGFPALEALIDRARAAHRIQETALGGLVRAAPQTDTWRERATHLRDLVGCHAVQEEREILPALRASTPRDAFAQLAGAFATERLRQLAMLQPSMPIYIPDDARPC